jgi:Flp pilus assembly protein TadG
MVKLKHRLKHWLFRRPLGKLARDRSGVSAVEFALIMPVMVTLYVGGIQVGEGFSIDRKVGHVSSTLADLVTQSTLLTTTDIGDIFDAASSLMEPYAADTLKMSITEIYIDANSVAKVKWSDARNMTAPSAGSTVTTLPAAAKVADSYVVATEVHYDYTPDIGYVLTGTFDLKSTYYLKPRVKKCITRGSVVCS